MRTTPFSAGLCILLSSALCAACMEGSVLGPPGDSGGGRDADGGAPGLDAGASGTDAGATSDAGAPIDAGTGLDAGSPDGGPALDGGVIAGIPGVTWTIQRTPSGYQWVSPLGAAVCKYAGVSKVDITDLQSANSASAVEGKYGGSWATWASAQSERLKSWGFNAAGMYSYEYMALRVPDGGLPGTPTEGFSWYAMKDSNPYHVKDVYGIANPAGMTCGTQIYQGIEMDPFDPEAQAALNALVGEASSIYRAYSATESMYYVVDEADYLFGIDTVGKHADVGFVVAANNPMVVKSASALGGGYTYPDKTLYAKLAMRDYLAAQYGCAGSADPASANYCGDTSASVALGALNVAWGTAFTTWSTSDSNGLAGIAGGTYSSWGIGTGLLDENGAHLLSLLQKSHCGGAGGNGPSAADAWGVTPRITTDLHGFVGLLAGTYARKVRAAWDAACAPNACPPLVMPLYDGPSYVYAAMAQYFDAFWISVGNASTDGVAEVQRIADALNGKPLIVGDYDTANGDSPMASTTCSEPCFPSQSARGAGMVAHWRAQLAVRAAGVYPVIGLEHWALYDSATEGQDFGLVTVAHDNPYDGTANVANGEATNYGDALTAIAAYLRGGICDP